jgi:Tol biopolymer transport system component
MATLNRLASFWPKGRSRFVATATAAGLAVCLGALAVAPSAPATFPGKNGRIAFSRTERGTYPVVYTMRRDGSHERRLAKGDSPAFSPSGRKVLLNPRRSEYLHTIRANGTRLRRIPHTRRGVGGSFAPGGKKIVFSRGFDFSPSASTAPTGSASSTTEAEEAEVISRRTESGSPSMMENLFHFPRKGHLDRPATSD